MQICINSRADVDCITKVVIPVRTECLKIFNVTCMELYV